MDDAFQPDGAVSDVADPFGLQDAPPFELPQSDTPVAPVEEPQTVEPTAEERLAEREAALADALTRAEAVERERDEYQSLVQQNNARAQQEQAQKWQQEEAQAKAHAKTLPYEEAIEYMDGFRRYREEQVWKWGQDNFVEKTRLEWTKDAEKLARANGLPDEDVELLVRVASASGDKRAMQEEAKRLKARNETSTQGLRAVQEELARLKAEMARQNIVSSGAQRVGGQGAGSVPTTFTKGTRDHLRYELYGKTG